MAGQTQSVSWEQSQRVSFSRMECQALVSVQSSQMEHTMCCLGGGGGAPLKGLSESQQATPLAGGSEEMLSIGSDPLQMDGVLPGLTPGRRHSCSQLHAAYLSTAHPTQQKASWWKVAMGQTPFHNS